MIIITLLSLVLEFVNRVDQRINISILILSNNNYLRA